MSALAALLLLLSQPPPPSDLPPVSYPLHQPQPDFLAPGRPFKLVDLRFEWSDTVTPDQAFLARVKVRDWGFLGARFAGDRRAVTLEARRLALSVGGSEGVWDLAGSYRARRVLLSAAAEAVTVPGLRGWRVEPALAVRLSPDFELLGRVSGDTRQRREPFVQAWSGGFLWQRGARWQAEGEYLHAREPIARTDENVRHTGRLALVAQTGPAELSGGVVLEDVRGRFPRRELTPDLGARVSLLPRLLLEGGARVRVERDTGQRFHHYDGALTWFGRRFYLPRAGPAAAPSVALARRATELGYNERRVFDDDERRAQRERLSLMAGAESLAEDMREVYRAQVAERPVPLLGLEIADEADALAGTESRIARLLVGVPWPPAWPWQGDEAAAPFLRLDLERERRLSAHDTVAFTHLVRLTVSLNREQDLRLFWSRAEPSAFDIVRGIGVQRTIGVSYAYAFGR
jgi:hypothetical protein